MAKPKVLVISGYGIHSDPETAYSFDKTGGNSEIIHINDLIANPQKLRESQILAFPGGFSYGDETGSGKAMANKIRNNIFEDLRKFIARDTLTIGICNGFQIITELGLVPAIDQKYGEPQVALMHNAQARLESRFVFIKNTSRKSIWTKNIELLHIPISHGEGNFYAPPSTLKKLIKNDQIALRYVDEKGQKARNIYPHNPNGSLDDIAGICDETGRILGLMPHPERFNSFFNEYDWPMKKEAFLRTGKKLPEEGAGLKLIANGVKYFK